MKKQRCHILLIIVLLTTAKTTVGQTKQLDWSSSRKINGLAIFSRVIGENKNGIYVLRYRNRFLTKQILIEQYDNGLGFVKTKPFNLKKARLLRLSIHPDGLIMLFVLQNKATRTMQLVARKLDPDLNVVGKDRILSESPFSDLYTTRDFFRSAFSANRKHLLIYSSQKLEDKMAFDVKIMNLDFDTIQHYSYRLEQPNTSYKLSDLEVDIDGNGYVLLKEFKQKTRRKFEERYRFFKYAKHQHQLTDYILGDSSSHLSKPYISEDRLNRRIQVTAWESKDFKDKYNKIYTFKLPLDTIEVSTEQISDIPESVLNETDQNELSPTIGYLSDFEILKVINRSDGGIIIVAESSIIRSEEDVYYVNGLPHTSSRNVYNFDDIIVINLDQDGKIDWSKVVPKSQSSINDGGYFSSAVIGITKDGLHIIYNENLRDNGEVIHYTLNLNGTTVNEKLFTGQGEYVVIIPPESLQVSSNKLLIPSNKNRKFALLKITYL